MPPAAGGSTLARRAPAGDNVGLSSNLSGGSLCSDKRPLSLGFYQGVLTDRPEMKVRTPESIGCRRLGVTVLLRHIGCFNLHLTYVNV